MMAFSAWQLSLGASLFLPSTTLALFDAHTPPILRPLRPYIALASWLAVVGWFVTITQWIDLVSIRVVERSWAGVAARSLYALRPTLAQAICVHFGMASLCSALTVLQVQLPLLSSADFFIFAARLLPHPSFLPTLSLAR